MQRAPPRFFRLLALPVDVMCMVAKATVSGSGAEGLPALACACKSLHEMIVEGLPELLAAVQCRAHIHRLGQLQGRRLETAFRLTGAGGVWDATLRLEAQLHARRHPDVISCEQVHAVVAACARCMSLPPHVTKELRHSVVAVAALAGRLCAEAGRSSSPRPAFAQLAPLAHDLEEAELEASDGGAEGVRGPEDFSALVVTGAFLAAALAADQKTAHECRRNPGLYRCMVHPCPCCELMHTHAYYTHSHPLTFAHGE